MTTPFGHKTYWIPALAFGLLLVAVFLNLGIYPLYLEEPRRALIALEMIFNDNLWVPTEFGEYYYKKPPLYNWVILAGYELFGYTEFAVRFFSVVSYLLMGGITFWAGRKYVNTTFGIYAAFFFYVCSDLLYYFTVTSGEIDLFYSLITYASFVALYYFYQKQQYTWLFLITYLLAALGTLTKGLPSIVFQGISLVAFFWWIWQFRRLFSWQHIAGMLLYALIVGGYLWAYSWHNDPLLYFGKEESILSQSTERTFFENSFGKLLIHLGTFPLVLMKILAPGSLLVFLFFKKSIREKLKTNPYIRFSGMLLLANLWVYWVSPGTASRYLYMMFPLAISVLVYLAHIYDGQKGDRIGKGFTLGLLILFLSTGVALPFIPQLHMVPHLTAVAVGTVIGFGLLLWAYWRWKLYWMMWGLTAFIVLRIVFDLVILPVRAYDPVQSRHVRDKALASEILSASGAQPVFLYENTTCSKTTIFYIERESQQVLRRNWKTEPGAFYIAETAFLIKAPPHTEHLRFQFENRDFVLITFTE